MQKEAMKNVNSRNRNNEDDNDIKKKINQLKSLEGKLIL